MVDIAVSRTDMSDVHFPHMARTIDQQAPCREGDGARTREGYLDALVLWMVCRTGSNE